MLDRVYSSTDLVDEGLFNFVRFKIYLATLSLSHGLQTLTCGMRDIVP